MFILSNFRSFPGNLLLLFCSVLVFQFGCGKTGGEGDEQGEDNLEAQEELEIPFFGGVQSTLTLIQGEAIIGEGFSGVGDSIHVIADFLGKGDEWDVICRRSPRDEIHASVVIDRRSFPIIGIGGLNTGRLPRGMIFEIAATSLTDPGKLDLLCAVGDGISNASLSVFRTTGSPEKPFSLVGVLEGESLFRIFMDGRIEAPVGTQGLTRAYLWNGTSFEEAQDNLL